MAPEFLRKLAKTNVLSNLAERVRELSSQIRGKPEQTESAKPSQEAEQISTSTPQPNDLGVVEATRTQFGEDRQVERASSGTTSEMPNGPAIAQIEPSTNFEILTDFDEVWYLGRYPDVARAVELGQLSTGLQHYITYGRAEGRLPKSPTAAGDVTN
jgi:hypothetical protein